VITAPKCLTLDEMARAIDANAKPDGRGAFQIHCPGPGHGDGDRRPSASLKMREDGKGGIIYCHAGCTAEQIMGGAGLTTAHLFFPTSNGNGHPPAKKKTKSKTIHETIDRAIDALRWSLEQHAGKLSLANRFRFVGGGMFTLRFHDETGKKHCGAVSKSGDGWIVGDPPKPLPLHIGGGGDELPASDTVYIFEGEGKADKGQQIGLASLSPSHGAKSADRHDWSMAKGKRAVICRDNDPAGIGFSNDVARLALAEGAIDVRIVNLCPDIDGGDIIDLAKRLEDDQKLKATILAVAEQAETVRPDTAAPASSDGQQKRNGNSGGSKKSSGAVTPANTTPSPDRPRVVLGTDEHRVIDEVEKALSADPELYHRGGVLVRVVRDSDRSDSISRPGGTPIISTATLPWTRERITRWAALLRVVQGKDGESEESAHPPQWLTPAVASRGVWPHLRRLDAISDAPILRPDGSIHQTPGYDERTGVLFQPSTTFPPIPEGANLDDADAAQARLMEIFCDFRFEAEEHRAAALAAVLTPLARHAFRGPAPAFLCDANVRGAGKGLFVQCGAEIVLGRSMPVCGYVHDSGEFAKRITSIAIAADPMVLLDNLTGHFGNDALDRALTAERWRDRLLGVSQMVDLPLLTTWYATGNNVQIGADTARRIIHIRLDVLDEHPEERANFRHPNLLGWVRENRPRLLVDALTILAAYANAGRPDQNLIPFGSFEAWSALVRSAVVWCGLPDPCATRARLAELTDTTADILGQLLNAVQQYDPHRTGFTVAEIVHRLYARDFAPCDLPAVAMRAALEALAGTPPGKSPSVRSIGTRLRTFRRRVVGGSFLDIDGSRKSSEGAVWRLFCSKNGGGQ